jgi:hypothetical protein
MVHTNVLFHLHVTLLIFGINYIREITKACTKGELKNGASCTRDLWAKAWLKSHDKEDSCVDSSHPCLPLKTCGSSDNCSRSWFFLFSPAVEKGGSKSSVR